MSLCTIYIVGGMRNVEERERAGITRTCLEIVPLEIIPNPSQDRNLSQFCRHMVKRGSFFPNQDNS